jgi:hypothetical protein
VSVLARDGSNRRYLAFWGATKTVAATLRDFPEDRDLQIAAFAAVSTMASEDDNSRALGPEVRWSCSDVVDASYPDSS